MVINNKKLQNTIISFAFLLVPVVALICLGVGRYSLSPWQILKSFGDAISGNAEDMMAKTVIFKVRLPRILLAIAIGAGLSCSGAAFQGLFSNPLATPDTLGVASGASFGAVIALLHFLFLFCSRLHSLPRPDASAAYSPRASGFGLLWRTFLRLNQQN